VNLERGPLSNTTKIEELLEKLVAPVQTIEITAVGIRRADHSTPLYQQKLALPSPTSGGRSVGIVRSRTKVTELLFVAYFINCFSIFTGGVAERSSLERSISVVT
jgi:hypothetical protein